MQNESYRSVRQSRSNSMFANWSLRRPGKRFPYFLDIYRLTNGLWPSRCFFLQCWSCGAYWIYPPQNRVPTTFLSTASELEMCAEGPLSGDYGVYILEKRLYDENMLFTRPLHLTMSLVQITMCCTPIIYIYLFELSYQLNCLVMRSWQQMA